MTKNYSLHKRIKLSENSQKFSDIVSFVSKPFEILEEKLKTPTSLVIKWGNEHQKEYQEIITSVTPASQFVSKNIINKISKDDYQILRDMAQQDETGAFLCLLSCAGSADILCYTGVWDKFTYQIYCLHEQQLKQQFLESAKETVEQIYTQPPFKNMAKLLNRYQMRLPVMIVRDGDMDLFERTCRSLREHNHFIKPDYTTMHFIENMQDYLSLNEAVTIYSDNGYFDLNEFIPPVTDWQKMNREEAERTVLYNTIRIVHKNLLDGKHDELFYNTIYLINDGFLKNAAKLAEKGALSGTKEGIRQFLMSSDLATLFSAEMKLLTEKERNEKLRTVIQNTRKFLETYSPVREWNEALLKWYDKCSQNFELALKNEQAVVIKHQTNLPFKQQQKEKTNE